MASSGDDLTQPRDIDFIVVFVDEKSAQDFASQVRQLGHEVFVERTETADQLPWDARVVQKMAPDHKVIGRFEEQLAAIAGMHGGRNDGWGCLSASEPLNSGDE
jgi:hypothetical protein